MICGYFGPRTFLFEEYQKLCISVREHLVLKMECDREETGAPLLYLEIKIQNWVISWKWPDPVLCTSAYESRLVL